MKNKFIVIGMILFLAIGLVSAAQGSMDKEDNEDGMAKPMLYGEKPMMAGGQGNMTQDGTGNGEGQALRTGSIELGNGKQVRVQQGENGLMLESNGQSANCESCNLSQVMVQGEMQIQAKMSNGKNSEIKVMPNQASEKAMTQLKLKNCLNETCSIELKEVGTGNGTKMAYAVKTEKKAKFLGIFGSTMNVEAQIDAETGEVLDTKKSWWAFMASEQDETTEAE